MPEQSCTAQTKSRLWPVQDHRPIFQSYFILIIAGLSSSISRDSLGGLRFKSYSHVLLRRPMECRCFHPCRKSREH